MRPPAAARTLDFIEARFEIYLAPGTQRFLDTRRITTVDPHFSRMCPIDNYTRTSYAVGVHCVLSCAARLALEGVTRIPRTGLILVIFLLRRTRFCFRGGFRCELPFPSCTIEVLDCVSGSRFIRPFFFHLASLWIIYGSAV